MMSPRLRIHDLRQDHLAAGRRDRIRGDAGRDDVVRAGAALHEIVGQVHHFAEAVVHHREPSVGAEHAQAVRHVVQRGIELAGQRGFAEARRQRLDEDGVQAEVDALEADEKQRQQHGEADVVKVAMRRQRQRHRAAGQQDVILDQLGTAVIAGRAAGGVADRDRDADHVRDRVVVAENGEEAPDAQHAGVDHGADRVARLQVLGLLERQHRVRRSYLRIWKARTVPMPTISTAHGHSSTLPVFSAVMTAATAVQTEPMNIGQKFWHMELISAA